MNSVQAITEKQIAGRWETIRAYIALTKPTIVTSFTLTGATALVMEKSLLVQPGQFFLVLLAILLTGAGANGLNQYFERDLDALMERTRKKRPLPLSKMAPKNALIFSLLMGVASVLILALWVNFLSAAYALGTILFYSFFYTLWLKPRTPYNIVIGGAAGATAPIIAWAAASGSISWTAWSLFLIIFMWTPPHFWALALCVKEQYAKVGLPMLPVVKGDERTRSEIWWYSLALVPLTFLPVLLKSSGWIYFWGALLLGLFFILQAWKVKTLKTEKAAYALFGYSIVYLMLLFIFLMVDSLYG
ncbi:MAG: heme o synthase [Deltaproteobacteria bacterium]|nr:heme o synthase [Deltaproteobacteria bacterium]